MKRISARLVFLLSLSIMIAALPVASMRLHAQTDYQEAPDLAARVSAGQLPPVKDRLPVEPLVVNPVESIGQYGGTLRTALRGGQDFAWMARTIAYEQLVSWNLEYTSTVPNVAKSIEISPDGTQYTFVLREGTKWSDGQPFTADDIMYWYKLYLDTKVNPGKDPFLFVGGKDVVVEKLDNYTVKFTFAAPNGLFLQRLAHPDSYRITQTPSHWYKQFYPADNPDADVLAKERGFNSADEYMTFLWDFSARFRIAEMPKLWAWLPTTNYAAETTLLTAERNPYYWKVDPEGKQLPYLDSVTFDVGADPESLLLKALNGEIDLLSRHINTVDNRAVLFENKERGNYDFYTLTSVNANTFALMFNLTTPDAAKREIFQNKDFRVALSHAINRQEIIDTVYVGQGTPSQVTAHPASEFYNEAAAKQFTEYDVETANALLDKIGLDKRDADNFRLGPDGQRFTVTVETIVTMREWVAVLELIKTYWEAVGIKTEIEPIDRALLQANIDANNYEAIVLWPEGGGGQELLLLPRMFAPVSIHSGFGVGWYYWGQNDSRGTDWTPPDNVKRTLDLYTELLRTADPAQQKVLAKDLVQQAADNFFNIGISTALDGYGIVSNRMRNVPKKGMWDSYAWPQPGAVRAEQFWMSTN